MGGLKRLLVAFAVIGLGVTLTPTVSGAAVSYKNFQADGWVATSDIAPPSQSGFILGNDPGGSGTLTTSGGVDPGRNADGTITIHANSTTKYWKYNASIGQYQSGTYDDVVKQGDHIHVGGRYTLVDNHYELFANFVWNPPKTSTSGTPPNPAPGVKQDFTFQRTYHAAGTVRQTGTTLLLNQGWNTNNGFVLGYITDYGPDDHVRRISAAHHDQLPIYTNNFTTFRLQNPDGTYTKTTKDAVITAGAQVLVGGHYAFVNLDWMFVANFVWRPAPGVAQGLIWFDTAPTDTHDNGTPTATGGWQGSTYSGQSTVSHVSNNDVNPGPVTFTLDWEFDPDSGLWLFAGKWTATKQNTSDGLSGDASGYWDPDTGNFIDATAVITQGTGIHCNVSGAGTLTGTGPNNPATVTQEPPVFLQVSLKLTTTRDTTIKC